MSNTYEVLKDKVKLGLLDIEELNNLCLDDLNKLNKLVIAEKKKFKENDLMLAEENKAAIFIDINSELIKEALKEKTKVKKTVLALLEQGGFSEDEVDTLNYMLSNL